MTCRAIGFGAVLGGISTAGLLGGNGFPAIFSAAFCNWKMAPPFPCVVRLGLPVPKIEFREREVAKCGIAHH